MDLDNTTLLRQIEVLLFQLQIKLTVLDQCFSARLPIRIIHLKDVFVQVRDFC